MTGIYKITSPTGKVYIGQSYDIEKRFRHYKRLDCKGQTKLFNSLSKHGYKNHSFEIVIILDSIIEPIELTKYEQAYMDEHKSKGIQLLNLRDAGVNGKMSEETKRKMSLQHMGNKSNTGRKLSEEHKANIGRGGKGRIMTEEHKAKLKLARATQVMKKGFKMSEASRLNQSIGKKLWWDNKKQQNAL